ncbi:MAG: peptide-methionine (S)-S-oxide reductase MsrA [Parcubacteria group bacterium]|jgi:peptide-methionine (S)-S-oxide reductase
MQTETAIFGGGCFWCVEAVFSSLQGVISVISGYTGGLTVNPNYEEVCSGETEHAEAVKVEFDPEIISYDVLLSIFFSTHDPTTLNQQGNDQGAQYRSIIFYSTEEQKQKAEKYIRELEREKIFTSSIVTELKPLGKFYPAEDYHQKYFDVNRQAPYCQFVINPKLEKLKKKYTKFLK